MTVKPGSHLLVVLGLLMAAETAPAQPLGTEAEARPEFFAPDPTLRAYVEDGLAQDPIVREAASRYRAALQEVPQVRALPDPMVTFTQAIRSVETRVGPQRQTLMLSQAFPWFGTLALREQVAVQTAAARYHDYVARQRDVIASVKQTFYDLAYVDRALALTQEDVVLLEQYEALAQARFATGQGLQQGVIHLNTRAVGMTLLVLLAVPLSLIGTFWLLFVLDYNLSVAVWVGVIALAGLSAETAVVMLLYLDVACEEARRAGRLHDIGALTAAIADGAARRPVIMLSASTVVGLLPIMWSQGTGADVMKRIAAPMVGGLVTVVGVVLIVFPAIYAIWRGWAFAPAGPERDGPTGG